MESPNKRKAELRVIMLDIIAGREKTKYPPSQEANLLAGVAEVIDRKSEQHRDKHNVFPPDSELEYEDKILAQEVFWDLIIERIITPGLDFPNSELPFFRIHSGARDRLTSAE